MIEINTIETFPQTSIPDRTCCSGATTNLPLIVLIIPSLHLLHILFTGCLLQFHKLHLKFQFPDLSPVTLTIPTLVRPRSTSAGTTTSRSRPLGTRDEILSLRSRERHCRVSVFPDEVPLRQNTPRILGNVVDFAYVVIKMRAGLGHTVEMFGLEQRPFEALALLRLVEFPISKRQRCLESVLDLPAIPVAGGLVFVIEPLLLRKLADLVF